MMFKFKFFFKSSQIEDWLNKQAQLGYKCIRAFPDYYLFMFEKSSSKKKYQVEALSFMQNKLRLKYLYSQADTGKHLINNSVSDGFYIFELPDGLEVSHNTESPLSLNPLFYKSFVCNFFISIGILVTREVLKLSGNIYYTMTGFSGFCILLMIYSLINILISMINYEKKLVDNSGEKK